MSSILEGLYKEEEQSAESELRRKLDKVESILGTRTDMRGRQFNQAIQDITKNIKYLQQDELVMEIYSKMQSMAQAIGLSEKELDYVEDDVREAFNNLESAVYKMEEPFEDYVRDLQYKVEELELDEGMYEQEAFNSIFGVDSKDRAKKREKPKSKPKDTGMYNQPNKADKDKEGEQLTEEQFDEAAGKKDACYHKVKSRYDVWPSAYASGALVKCRKVGAANWGNSAKEEFEKDGISFQQFQEKCWKGYEKKGMKTMFGKRYPNCVKKEETEVVREDDMKGMSVKSGHKRSTKSGAGMTKKGVEAYRRRNPGSKLKTAVTTPPSKLKAGSKSANRRKSYCARSAGQMKKFPKAAKDPDSRLRQARRRWNC